MLLKDLRKYPWHLLVDYNQKDLKISCTIERSWYSHESEGLNPDWLGQSKSFSSRYSQIELKITISKIFPRIGNREAVLQLSTICLSPFLWTRTIFDFFQIYGKVLLSIQFWNNMDRGVMIDISSCPWALLMWKALRIFKFWKT